MQRRTFASVLAILLVGPVLTLIPLSGSAYGQFRLAQTAAEGPAQLQALVAEGERLESERRWGEALTHWEDALRTFPGQQALEQRRERTKVHFDLARRYNDTSFVRSISVLSLEQSLDLYNEVLLKINTYYVDSPNWQGMVARGTFALENALLDEAFIKQNAPRATPESIAVLRSELHRQLDWRQIRSTQEARDAVNVAARMTQTRLGVAPSAVVLEYACGAMGGLDDYSSYLTEAQLDDVYSQIEGNFVGLGVELKSEHKTLSVVNVIEGSPAYRAGMRGGDVITAVDGQTTADVSTDKAADMLKGVEGTTVDVTVLSAQGVSRVLRIRRERVDVPSVEGIRIVDVQNGIAYLKINSFQKTTTRDLDAALWKLYREGMRSLIIDVRGNPGGLLTSSVEIADKFIADGTIVSTRGRSPREDFDYKAHKVGTWRVPLYVLIDGDSASAAEIFAGAIRDHRRGTVIGQRSYGKGSVQGIFPLGATKAGVRLTTAKFYSPSGQAIAKRGVEPNLVVHVAKKPVEASTTTEEPQDTVLEAALQTARQQLVSQR